MPFRKPLICLHDAAQVSGGEGRVVPGSTMRATRRAVFGVALATGGDRLFASPGAGAKSKSTREAIARTYRNTTPIRIAYPNSAGITANPYPAVITVNDLVDPLYCVPSITLRGLTHPAPENLIVVLEAPGGVWTDLMEAAGGTTPVSGVDLVLNKAAAPSVPDNGPLVSGTYSGGCYGTSLDTFLLPKPGPQTNGSRTCGYTSAFAAASPLGEWKLWIHDRSGTFVGQVASGWDLHLEGTAMIQHKRKKRKRKKKH